MLSLLLQALYYALQVVTCVFIILNAGRNLNYW